MAKLDILFIPFQGNDYLATIIPDIFTGKNEAILIGSNSLNHALFNDDKGYPNESARNIDEQVYAYIDDEFFVLSYKDFIDKVKKLLD